MDMFFHNWMTKKKESRSKTERGKKCAVCILSHRHSVPSAATNAILFSRNEPQSQNAKSKYKFKRNVWMAVCDSHRGVNRHSNTIFYEH